MSVSIDGVKRYMADLSSPAVIGVVVGLIPTLIKFILDKVLKGEATRGAWNKITSKLGHVVATGVLVILVLGSGALLARQGNPCTWNVRPPAEIAKHEVLAILSQYRLTSGAQVQPADQWSLVLKNKVTEIDKDANIKIVEIPQTISNDEQAKMVSVCYNATLIMYGEVGDAVIESNVVVTPRWSFADSPGRSFLLDRNEDVVKQFIRVGGDSEYVLSAVLAQLYFNAFENDKALSILNNIITNLLPKGREKEMRVSEVYRLRMHVYNYLHRFDLALADADSILALGEPVKGHAAKAMILVNMHSYDRALDEISFAINLLPEEAALYANRGQIYRASGQPVRALEDYNHAIKLAPNEILGYINRAQLYIETDQSLGDAHTDLLTAIRLSPSDGYAYFMLGKLLRKEGFYSEALDNLFRSLELDPFNSSAWAEKGGVYIDARSYELAITAFNQAIALEPNSPEFYHGRGLAYIAKHQPSQALQDCQRADRLVPNDWQSYLCMALAYTQLGDDKQELDSLLKYLELAGSTANPDAVNRAKVLQKSLAQRSSILSGFVVSPRMVIARKLTTRKKRSSGS